MSLSCNVSEVLHTFAVYDLEGIDLIRFEKGQREDDAAQEYLAKFSGE